jgi:hypothetical protein
LNAALDFVKSLRPEHLQSFWYSASKYNFALIGTFIGLLWATSLKQEEAQSYKGKLEEYRWTLRLSSKSAEILDRAASMLTTSTGILVKGIPEKGSVDSREESRVADSPEDVDNVEHPTDQNEWAPPAVSDISMQTSPTPFSEGAMDMFWPELPIDQTKYDVAAGFNDAANDSLHGFLSPDDHVRRY